MDDAAPRDAPPRTTCHPPSHVAGAARSATRLLDQFASLSSSGSRSERRVRIARTSIQPCPMLSWTLGVASPQIRLNRIYASTHVPSFEPPYEQRSDLGVVD